jgi:hypothetical protein
LIANRRLSSIPGPATAAGVLSARLRYRLLSPAETIGLGVIPDMSQIQLHADAAPNAMADAGLKPSDIDGIATAGETPITITHYRGLTPKWVDGTFSPFRTTRPPYRRATHAGRIWPVLLEGSASSQTSRQRRDSSIASTPCDYEPFVGGVADLFQDIARLGAVTWRDQGH